MWNILYSILAILICLLLGYCTYYLIGGIPASLYGMLILTICLSLNVIKADRINQTIQFIISNMGVCFVPAAVGIIEYVSLIKSYGLIITISVIFTTFALITIVAMLYQYFVENEQDSTLTNKGNSDD